MRESFLNPPTLKKFELLMTPEARLNRTLPLLLHIATVTTGLIDAISYLALGHVFTANMTGNIVFLGFAVGGAPGLSLTRSLTALVAFLIGALIGGRAALRLSEVSTPRWLTTALSLESALLLVATLAAINLRNSSGSSFQVYSIIVLTACAWDSKRDSSQDGDPRSHDYGSYPDHHWSRSRFKIRRRYESTMAPPASRRSTDVLWSSDRNAVTKALVGVALGYRDTLVNLLCRHIKETARCFGDACIVTTSRRAFAKVKADTIGL